MIAHAPARPSDKPVAGRDLHRFRKGEVCPACGRTQPDGCARLESGAVLCFHADSDQPAPNGGGYVHWPEGRGDDWRERRPPPTPTAAVPAPDPGRRHAYLADLLACCPLSDNDHAALRIRGLTDEQIARHGYGTLPPRGPERERIAASLWATHGGGTAGTTPGLHRRDSRALLGTGLDAGGILVAIRRGDRLVGFQVRIANPGPKEPKYKWLSSPEHPSGAPAHVAEPARRRGGTRPPIITEGPLKANVAADRLGVPVVGAPGVTITREVLELLRELGAVEAVIAFDKDPEPKPEVAAAEARLAREIHGAGVQVWQAVWDAADAKGIDDLLLVADLYPFAVPHPDAETAQPPDPEETSRLRAERDAARAHAQRTVQILGNKRLGGDTAPIVAALTYADLRARVADAPAADGRYRLSVSGIVGGEQNAKGNIVNGRVSQGTVKKTWATWAEAGLLPIEVAEEPYRLPGGGDGSRKVYTLVVPGNDLDAVAERLIHGSARERSMRGHGRRCQACGGTAFEKTVRHVCTGCGTVEESAAVAVDYGRDQPDAAHLQTLQAPLDEVDGAGDPWDEDPNDGRRQPLQAASEAAWGWPQSLRVVGEPDAPAEHSPPENVLYRQSSQAGADPDRLVRARADLARRLATSSFGESLAGEEPPASPPPQPVPLPGVAPPPLDRWTG